jgi:hypothetical protein
MLHNRTLYTVLCLVLPLVWGVAAAWVFDWIEARRPPRPPAAPGAADAEADLPEMYHI